MDANTYSFKHQKYISKKQYFSDILGIDNPTQQELDQTSLMSVDEGQLLALALGQFIEMGHMSDPFQSLLRSDTLVISLIVLQANQLADVFTFDTYGEKLISVDVSEMIHTPPFWKKEHFIIFQNHFDMYIDAYNADAHLRENPAICNDGHISSSGSLDNYQTKMGQKWQESYGIESDRGVCTKHDGVKEMISLSKYKKLKPKVVKEFDPDFEGDDDLVTYRSSRQPNLSKAQQIAKAKKEKAKKAKAKAKSNPRNVSFEIELPNTNLFVVGAGFDTNGNSVIRFQFPNQRAFSVQVYGDMFNDEWKELFHTRDLSEHSLLSLEQQIIEYIHEYGSKQQQNSLRVY